MYIKAISLHSEAFMCRERERGREEERVCVLGGGGGAAIVWDLFFRGAALFVVVGGLQKTAGENFGVVLCNFEKGLKAFVIAF